MAWLRTMGSYLVVPIFSQFKMWQFVLGYMVSATGNRLWPDLLTNIQNRLFLQSKSSLSALLFSYNRGRSGFMSFPKGMKAKWKQNAIIRVSIQFSVLHLHFLCWTSHMVYLQAKLAEHCLWVQFSVGVPYFWPYAY